MILQARRAALEALSQRLVEKEVIDGDAVRALLETHYPGPKLVPGSQAIAISQTDEAPAEPTPLPCEGAV